MQNENSCGTVVFHQTDNYEYTFLLIKQQNTYHWGFPKGHVEHKESRVQAALRETYEETGLEVNLYHFIKDQVIYHPLSTIKKRVTYYLARSMHQDVIMQIDEIVDYKWATYDEVLQTLTFENDQHLFISLIHQAQEKQVFISPSLINHMEKNIIPLYEKLDQAHQIDHVEKVIKQALDFARHFDVYHHMIYVIACYHDVGMIHGRADHHITGHNMLKADKKLAQWFTDEQIYIMSQAVKDHRASKAHPPKTIYGQIIAQADRDLDLDCILKRIILFAKSSYPHIAFDDFFIEGYKHLKEKYGKNGYMALLIKTEELQKKVDFLQKQIEDIVFIRNKFHTLFNQS